MKYVIAVILAFQFSLAWSMQLSTACSSCSALPSSSNSSTSANASASPTANSVAGSNSGANQQNITFNSQTPADTNANVNYSGSQTIKNVPSVSAPPLVSSNDTCMGSFAGGGSGPGFSITLGKTYTDDNCVMLKNSRELWNMGMRAAALALMCNDPANRKALDETGYKCPGDTNSSAQVAVAQQTNSSEPTDPFIRYREGLPPLPGQQNEPPYKN